MGGGGGAAPCTHTSTASPSSSAPHFTPRTRKPPPRPREPPCPVPAHLPGTPRSHLQTWKGASRARGRPAADPGSVCKYSSRRPRRGAGPPPPSPRPGGHPFCRRGRAAALGQGRRLLGASAEVSGSRGPSHHNKPRATWMWRKEMGSELRLPETAQLKAYNRPLQTGTSRRVLPDEAGRGAGRQEGRLGRCAPRGDAGALNPQPSFPSLLLWHEASLPPSCPGQRSEGRCHVQPRPLVAGTTPARTRLLVPARGGYQRSFSVRPWAMASLRNANPRLKNYFKENYIPQVCEVLDTRGGGHGPTVGN